MVLRQVTIVGLGLIGGSYGLALKRAKPELTVVGVDIDQESLDLGVSMKAIDWGTTDMARGVQEADVVIFATLVKAMPGLLRAAAPHLKPGAVVTDVGSTKSKLVAELRPLLPPGVTYVGGHPMAGSEMKGIKGADPYLFENAVYVLTPLPDADPAAVEVVQELVRAVGAQVLLMSPEVHDQIVAAISHLPHVAAAALVNAVAKREQTLPGIFPLAAGGFRDATRIAGSSPEMWRDIFLDNRETLLPMIQCFREALTELEEAIRSEQGERVYRLLRQAQELRSQIPAKQKGLLPGIHEVVVTVPDRPGEIGKLAALLGINGINIMDIEILRIREGDGGTIRLGFATGEEAGRALKVLTNNDYVAWLKS
ncbi:MAG TPA: prephenate dehydrogenase [Clostridia bacterium]|nr:prephenate dehydrogenase [Clostridia bacterium]